MSRSYRSVMINKLVNDKGSIIDWSAFAFEKANCNDVFIVEFKTMIDAILK